MPTRMPSAIEYVSGIVTIVRKAGIDSDMSSRLISFIPLNMLKPTMISIGAVAAAGIDKNSGERNRANMKHMAIVRDVSPVRPPWATPDELSMNVHAADVPNSPDAIVPNESEMKSLLIPGIFPFLSLNPPFWHTPMADPVRLNRSINIKDSTTINISIDNILSNLN